MEEIQNEDFQIEWNNRQESVSSLSHFAFEKTMFLYLTAASLTQIRIVLVRSADIAR